MGKINDTCILTVEDDQIYSISATQDNSMFLLATLKGDFDVSTTLNLPSLKKLSKALDMTGEEEVELKINANHLEYKGKAIKFKYHLHDEGILNKPKLSLEKIKSFKFDTEFSVEKEFWSQLLKNSSVFSDTKKLYIFTDDDHIVWSLADKTLTNTDALTVVGEKVDFDLDTFILSLENLRLISFASEKDITLKVNSTVGIGSFALKTNDFNLNYILTSLTR